MSLRSEHFTPVNKQRDKAIDLISDFLQNKEIEGFGIVRDLDSVDELARTLYDLDFRINVGGDK